MQDINPQTFKAFLHELVRTTGKRVRSITNTDLLIFFSRRTCPKCDRVFLSQIELAKHQLNDHMNFDGIDLDPMLLIDESIFIHSNSPGFQS